VLDCQITYILNILLPVSYRRSHRKRWHAIQFTV